MQSDVAPLRRVLLKHARDAFVGRDRIESEWRGLHYAFAPDLERAIEQSDALAGLLERLGVEVRFVPPAEGVAIDSIYVRDAAVVCDEGAILCRMGKPSRAPEPTALTPALAEAGVPVLGAIEGDGRLEGGDVVWIDRRTIAVGRGYRTNDDGIRQLRALLGDRIDRLVSVPLPHATGPEGVFHLMSVISPLDRDLALVHSPLMPVPFREWLIDLGIRLIEVPAEEYATLGCNVLAVAPRVCLLAADNPRTARLLEQAGVEVHPFEARDIGLAGAGGPTCLTRPLERG